MNPYLSTMLTVSLHGAEFFAYHGFYPEEQLLGCRFIVNIDVTFNPDADLNKDELADTVNYEQLYLIATEEMRNTRKLLEPVAQGILDRIAHNYPYLTQIVVELKKLNPPLGGPVAWSAVKVVHSK